MRFIVVILSVLLPNFAFSAPLRVSLNAWPGYEDIYLADELGYFKDEGLDVKIIQFEALAEGRRAFESDQVDILPATAVDLMMVNGSGRIKAKAMAVVDYSNGGDAILAGEHIKTPKDLKGKVVGLEVGSVNLFVLARALNKAGLSVKDIRVKNLAQNELIQILKKKELDAVVTYPPFMVEMLNDKGLKLNTLFTTKEIPGEVVDLIIVKDEDIKSRADDLRKFNRAFWRARAYANQNRAKANEIMAKRERISPQEFSDIITHDIKLLDQDESIRILKDDKKFSNLLTLFSQTLVDVGAIRNPPKGFDGDLIFIP